MTESEVFEIWAPTASPWSPWVKPVLFAHFDRAAKAMAENPTLAASLPAIPLAHWAPPADGRTALVLDLPGSSGVGMGMAMAHLGYRPIALYNAIPTPTSSSISTVADALVDVLPIVAALMTATKELAATSLPPDAPPAFLLDSSRRVGRMISPEPGLFDNRSVSLPTDFPSANFLLSRGIRQVVMVRQNTTDPQADLSHTLLRWQRAGISILAVSVESDATAPTPIVVKKPPFFRLLWQRLIATAGLKRSPLGGFGGFLPIPSGGGSVG